MEYVIPVIKYIPPPYDVVVNYIVLTVFMFAAIFFIFYLIYAIWAITKVKKPVYIPRYDENK